VETCPDIIGILRQIKSLGCRAGAVLNPETPVGAIQHAFTEADLILVMSVHPGYSGQSFIPETITKVSEIRKKLDALRSPAWLEVDGGIDLDTLPKMREAGATAYVAATAVFKHPEGPAAGVRSLKDVIARSGAQAPRRSNPHDNEEIASGRASSQ
jgi:ribulose-phosphate 3-epimerase